MKGYEDPEAKRAQANLRKMRTPGIMTPVMDLADNPAGSVPGGMALIQRMLAGSKPQSAAPLPGDEQDQVRYGYTPQLAAFRKTTFADLPAHQPSTGLGKFGVKLTPAAGPGYALLTIRVNYGVNWINGNPNFFKAEGQPGKHLWTPESKAWFQERLRITLKSAWDQKFAFVHPGYTFTEEKRNEAGKLTAYNTLPYPVVTRIEPVMEGEGVRHVTLNVTKRPEGYETRSFLKQTHDDTLRNESMGLNSSDVRKTTHTHNYQPFEQTTTNHEFGHLFGLGDEYIEAGKEHTIYEKALAKKMLNLDLQPGMNDSVMSIGNTVKDYHYVTFLEALHTITGDPGWVFKKH